MGFADGWGWGEWIALALPMLMFFAVVGGAGYMIWRREDDEPEPPGGDRPHPGGGAPS